MLVQGFQRVAHRVVLGQALRTAPGVGPTGAPTLGSATAPTGEPPATPTGSAAGRPVGMGEVAAEGPPPGPLALLSRFPVLQRIPARLIAIGPLPEHAPAWARRPAESPTPTPRP
mgnify:CR=1 FL=1